ncbi:interferon-induced very large GTPase 1-like [Lampetra fluviatilis]
MQQPAPRTQERASDRPRLLPPVKEFVTAGGDWAAFTRRFEVAYQSEGLMEEEALRVLPTALDNDALAAFRAIPVKSRSTILRAYREMADVFEPLSNTRQKFLQWRRGEAETPLAYRRALMALWQAGYLRMNLAALHSLTMEKLLVLAQEMGIVLPVVDEEAQTSLWHCPCSSGAGRCKPPVAGSLHVVAALGEGESAKVVVLGNSTFNLTSAEWGRLQLEEGSLMALRHCAELQCKGSAPTGEQELALSYLQKLMMIDYRARCVSFQCENQDDNDDDVINNSEGPRTNTETHIHPMDLQMAIFHCGDNFVRQYIYTKLSFIQFALPLLVPNPCRSETEFPIWSFRQIKKSWKYRDASTNEWQSKNCAINDANTALVSFIRFGKSLSSKSQIMNSLLGNQTHRVFFHRHCRGSSRNVQLMKGVAEIAWYLPGGKDNDVFNDCIAFTNLHGDAREHKAQVKFLHEISSINVILLSDGDRNEEGKRILDECLSSSKPLICLCADKKRFSSGVSGTNAKIAVENRNEAELIDELTSIIKLFLNNSKIKINIEACSTIARQHGFIVDEDDKQCEEGKDMAKVLLSLISVKPLCSIKETFLPLQGTLWQSWCKKDKELKRMTVRGGQSVEEYKSNILGEKTRIRKAQLEKAFPLNEFMRSLIEILNQKACTVKTYFLHWLRIYLDNMSADRLSQLHLTYHQAWTAIKALKKQGSNTSTIATKQTELDKISEELEASSFGIDHVFREVGQIYEASQTTPSVDKLPATLPKIAAEMMISGFPLELMDGDAAHVPLIWISSILDEIIAKIGNVKLFVISILGIQSSGKSTLLNAMFGLQVPVGSGRCTRGAYMQLVKVEAEFSKQLGYEFVLIVDTEGLRSVELSNATRSHDNQLATFVIGLGNMTVINIFGENPSEMQDILQIAVQAFLRMRQVKLSPSCVFVHQNVGEVTAHNKNMEGRRRFQEKLDEMTRMAADQEQCAVASFDAVIRFDVNSQIRYFAHLWEGDPPMAPPNPSYCQNIKDLKEMLLRNATKEKTINVLKISEFKARIKDLWTALLAENFVFSFKNTIEIAAYTKLEEMYGKWTWELRSHVLQQENKLYNSIDNNADTMTRLQIERRILSNYQDIKKKMEEHFNSADDAELLVQWKVKFEKGFETVKEELVFDAYKNYSALMAQKDKKRNLDLQRSSYEYQLIRKSKDLASKLRVNTVNDEELKNDFDKIWKEWIKVIKYGMTSPATLDVKKEIKNLLYDVYENQTPHLEKSTRGRLSEGILTRFRSCSPRIRLDPR